MPPLYLSLQHDQRRHRVQQAGPGQHPGERTVQPAHHLAGRVPGQGEPASGPRPSAPRRPRAPSRSLPGRRPQPRRAGPQRPDLAYRVPAGPVRDIGEQPEDVWPAPVGQDVLGEGDQRPPVRGCEVQRPDRSRLVLLAGLPGEQVEALRLAVQPPPAAAADPPLQQGRGAHAVPARSVRVAEKVELRPVRPGPSEPEHGQRPDVVRPHQGQRQPGLGQQRDQRPHHPVRRRGDGDLDVAVRLPGRHPVLAVQHRVLHPGRGQRVEQQAGEVPPGGGDGYLNRWMRRHRGGGDGGRRRSRRPRRGPVPRR